MPPSTCSLEVTPERRGSRPGLLRHAMFRDPNHLAHSSRAIGWADGQVPAASSLSAVPAVNAEGPMADSPNDSKDAPDARQAAGSSAEQALIDARRAKAARLRERKENPFAN